MSETRQASFSSRPNFILRATATVSGTSVTMTAEAIRTGSENTTPFANAGSGSERTYSFSNATTTPSGSADWVFDFRPATSSSSTNPYPVGVWSSGVTRTVTGSGSVTVTAFMSLLGSASVTVPYTVATTPNPPVISGSVPSSATRGSTYSGATLSATNNPTTWGFSGSFPPGISGTPSGSNYFISGTPTASGTYNFSISASNTGGSDTKSYSITVSEPLPNPPVISGSFSSGTVGVSYSSFVSASNSPTSWSRSGSLPSGLSGFSSGSNYFVEGTPNSAGTSSFSLTASNAGGSSGAQNFSITINSPPNPSWNSTANFPAGKVNQSYSQTRSASNTTSISVATAFPAPGLSATVSGSNTLVLSGTPTTAGTYSVSATANGQSGTTPANLNVSVTINPLVPPTWTDQTVSTNFIVGTAYSDAVAASGATSYAIATGSLPSGVSLNTSTGAITGTPTTKQSFNFSLRASNADGNITTNIFSGDTVAPPVWTDQTLGDFLQGRAYNDGVAATSPIPASPTVYAVTAGSLPTGIILNSSTGALTGTPTGSGSFSFTISATNADGTISATFTGTLRLPPNWIDNELSSFVENIPYSDFVSATNSPTYSISSGALPTGVTLNTTTGLVSGTPTTVNQAYNFTVRALNADGNVTQSFSGTVNPDLGGGIKLYSGAAWGNKDIYVYSGGTWKLGKIHRFNGSIWVKSLF